MTLNGRVIVSAVMLAIFAGMVAIAAAWSFKAQLLPLVIGIPGMILCAIQLGIDLRRPPPAPEEATPPDERRRELAMFGWFALFLVGILGFGFVAAAPVLIIAFLRFGQGESWAMSLIMGAAGVAVIYGMFEVVLRIPLYEGLILGRLL